MNGVWITIEMMSHEPVRTINDMRKMKIRAHGGSADALKAIGITTYAVPWGELPSAAERRVVDASIMGCPVDAYDFGFGDIFSYWERIKFFYFPYTLVINMDTWKKPPADVQQVMKDVSELMPTKAYELYLAEEKRLRRSL
jgi:TRAP-type C4-dicarboxylate transport system substrate-binding protein